MLPHLSIRYLPTGSVKVNLLGTVRTYSFRSWLNRTDEAIKVRQASPHPKPVTGAEKTAALWLHAAGLNKAETIQAYLSRRPLLDAPDDDSKIIRCRKCKRVLSDPLSKALGLGPKCRTN